MMKRLTCLMILMMGLGLFGCESKEMAVGKEATPLPKESSAGFLDRVSKKEKVSENDAMRAVILLLEGKDEHESFAQRVQWLREREIVPDRWDFQPERPVTRGRLAYMLYQAMDLPGGVILMMTGPSQRYCLRELQYRDFMEDETCFFGKVTGMEFVDTIDKTNFYLVHKKFPNADNLLESGK